MELFNILIKLLSTSVNYIIFTIKFIQFLAHLAIAWILVNKILSKHHKFHKSTMKTNKISETSVMAYHLGVSATIS